MRDTLKKNWIRNLSFHKATLLISDQDKFKWSVDIFSEYGGFVNRGRLPTNKRLAQGYILKNIIFWKYDGRYQMNYK